MEWFLEIFDDTSDRARFFAILISSIVAVSVVLLNKHLERKAARRDLLIEKLEEIVNELQSINDTLNIMEGVSSSIAQDKLRSSLTSIDRVRVLCVLYFPDTFKTSFSQCEREISGMSIHLCRYPNSLHEPLKQAYTSTIKQVSTHLLIEVIQHMQEIRH